MDIDIYSDGTKTIRVSKNVGQDVIDELSRRNFRKIDDTTPVVPEEESPIQKFFAHPVKQTAGLIFNPLSKTITGQSLEEKAFEATKPEEIEPGNQFDYWSKLLKNAGAGTVGGVADVLTTPFTYAPIPFLGKVEKAVGKIPIRGTTLGEVATKVPIQKFFSKDVANIVKAQSEKILADSLAREGVNPRLANIITAIEKANPLSEEQQMINEATRIQRMVKAEKAGKGLKGMKQYEIQKGALGGKFNQAQQLEPLKLNPDDMDYAFEVVENSNLPFGDKMTVKHGLARLFGEEGTTVPTKRQLELMTEVYPNKFVESILNKRTLGERFMDHMYDVANIPRSMMSTFDLSAPFVQGLFLITKPKLWVPAFRDMFKYFFSEKAYQDLLTRDIPSRPTYKLMRKFKVPFTDMRINPLKREETFMSNFAEKIPGLGRIIRGSNRAYSGFLNKLRADTFDYFVNMAKNEQEIVTNLISLKQLPESALTKGLYGKSSTISANKLFKKYGQDIVAGKEVIQDLEQVVDKRFLETASDFIGSATGRGNLPKSIARMTSVLNATFFSPRLMASRINLLNPYYYSTLHPTVRKEALKSLFSLGGLAMSVLGLAKLGGADVTFNPQNADFGKIKLGKTRYDVLGGFGPYLKLFTQLATGETISSFTGVKKKIGEGYNPVTRWDLIQRAVEAKAAPTTSFAIDWLKGKDFAGKDFNVPQEILDRFMPIVTQDLRDLIHEGGLKDMAKIIPGVFGIGTQTYNVEPDDIVYIARATKEYANELIKNGDASGAVEIMERNRNEIEMSRFLEGLSERKDKLEQLITKVKKNVLYSPEQKSELIKQYRTAIEAITQQMEEIVQNRKDAGLYS